MDVELSSEVGIAGQLFKSCVDLFWLLIQRINVEEAVEQDNKLALRDEFARFYFWGEGFQPEKGGLDEILRFSSSLRDQTISLLAEIGRALCSRETGNPPGSMFSHPIGILTVFIRVFPSHWLRGY